MTPLDACRAETADEALDRLRRLLEAGADVGGRPWAHSGRNPKPRGPRSHLRYVCLFTGIVAFVLGFVFGSFLPAVLLPERTPPANGSGAAVSTVATAPVPLPGRFERVSFVGREGPAGVPDAAVVAGVYWGDLVEAALPAGFSREDATAWRGHTRNLSVVQLKEGCGRMQNRLVKFSDGTVSCCRYRRNTDQIQGELFSFYLGQALGLRNLVPTTLGLVKMRDAKWSSVRSEMLFAQWSEDKPVVLTKFVPNLVTAFIPFSFRSANRRLHPPDVARNASDLQNLVELAQWSDMIIFDYLTANLDRVVNNLYNLQWNFAMMDAPTHNLRRTVRDKLLVFLDNESGLLHGYRLLDKYESYYSALLDSLCVFRRSTADVVKRLRRDGNIGDILQAAFAENEPEFREHLPGLPDRSVAILNERIVRVADVIEKCEALFAAPGSAPPATNPPG